MSEASDEYWDAIASADRRVDAMREQRDTLRARVAELESALTKARRRMHHIYAGDCDRAALDRWTADADAALRGEDAP